MNASQQPDLRIRVCAAHTGSEFELTIATMDTVSDLQMYIASHADVPTHDQILLSEDGSRFDPRSRLGSYEYLQATEDAAVIFLFNRQHLKGGGSSGVVGDGGQGAPSPLRLHESLMEVNVPTSLQSSSSMSSGQQQHPLQKSTSVMVRNLPDYLHHFELHIQQAQAYIEAANTRVRICWDMLVAQRMQSRALDAAGLNLVGHKAHVEKALTEFLATYEERNSEHMILLDGFERDVAELRNVELHPQLQTAERTTLLDCVTEGKLRTWAKVCRQDQDKLSKMVQKLQVTFDSLQAAIDGQAATNGFNELTQLETELKSTDSVREEQQSILQMLLKDHQSVDKLVNRLVAGLHADDDDDVGGDDGGADDNNDDHASVVDACYAFEVQDKQHQRELIPRLQAIDAELRSLAQRFVESQARTQRNHFYKRLKTISEVQRDMRSIVGKTTAFSTALTRLDEYFAQLKAVRSMPSAYRATVAEVSRRHAYNQLIETQAGSFQKLMQVSRDEETNRRNAFFQEHGQYMPQDLIEGLQDRPAYARLQVKNSQSSLPQIHVDESVAKEVRAAFADDTTSSTSTVAAAAASSSSTATTPTPTAVAAALATSSGSNSDETIRMLELENDYLKAELALMNFDMTSSILPSLSQMKSLTATRSMLESKAPGSADASLIGGAGGRARQQNMGRLSHLEVLQRFIHKIMDSDRGNHSVYKSLIHTLQQKPTNTPPPPAAAAASSSSGSPGRSSGDTQQKLAKVQKQLQAAKSKNSQLKRQVQECQTNSADLENKLHELQTGLAEVTTLRADNERIQSEMKTVKRDLDDMMRRTAVLLNENAQLSDAKEVWQEIGRMKIAYSSFQIKDVVLFYKNDRGHYEAFNRGLPNRYLAHESEHSISDENRMKHFVVGEIAYIEEHIAGTDEPRNPFDLPEGTRYWTLTTELLKLH